MPMINGPTLVLESSRERQFMRCLLQDLGPEAPVVLIGSHARKRAVAPWSDIDLLVLGEQIPASVPPRVQVIRLTRDELARRVRDGDDFAQWALRFGQPLSGERSWRTLREQLLTGAPWPRSEPKYALSRKKLAAARDLLAMRDLPAAEEETRFALAHLARGLLLERHVFPLSRPELSDQMRAAGFPTIAYWLRRLSESEPMVLGELVKAQEAAEAELRAVGDTRSNSD